MRSGGSREIDLATSQIEAEALGASSQRSRDPCLPWHRGPAARRQLRADAGSKAGVFPNLAPGISAGEQPPSICSEWRSGLGPGRQGPPRVVAAVPNVPSEDDADADRLPAGLLGSDDEIAPTPVKVADRKDATTIEMIIDSPQSFEDRTITLEGLYKVATLLTRMKGSDSNPIGWSLPVGGADDRLICKADGKVVGRDRYLLLDKDLGPILFKAYDDLKFRPAARADVQMHADCYGPPHGRQQRQGPGYHHRRPGDPGSLRFPPDRSQYEKAFWTVQVEPEKCSGLTMVTGPRGPAVGRREEKFVKPIRKRLRDLQRRAIAEQGHAVVGSILQAELARSVNMAIVNQQQQAASRRQ